MGLWYVSSPSIAILWLAKDPFICLVHLTYINALNKIQCFRLFCFTYFMFHFPSCIILTRSKRILSQIMSVLCWNYTNKMFLYIKVDCWHWNWILPFQTNRHLEYLDFVQPQRTWSSPQSWNESSSHESSSNSQYQPTLWKYEIEKIHTNEICNDRSPILRFL